MAELPQNKPFRSKLAFRIVVGIILVAVVTGALFLLVYVRESNNLRQGAQNGFELTGTYQHETPAGVITFTVFREENGKQLWQLQDNDQVRNKGTVESTVDPNQYLLEDTDGSEVGQIHLAYSNLEGTGMLYLAYGEDEMIEIEKRGSAPVTIGPTVDLTQGDETNATHAPSTIAVLNAWGREGAAAQVGDKLTQAGYKDVVAKNAPMQDYPTSTVLFRGNESKDSAEDIARIEGIETVDQLEDGSTWAQEYEIVVIIGQDAYGSVA